MSIVLDNINISKKDIDKWILASPYSSIIINKELFHLFSILKKSETLIIAYKSFNNFFENELTFEQFTNLVLKHFGGRGFLNNDQLNAHSKSYLKFKINIFSKKFGEVISNTFGFLFNPKAIYLLFFTIIIGISVIFYLYHFRLSSVIVFDLFFSFIALNISLLFHEIGHISAYNYFLKKSNLISFKTSGQIGFGFYFIFPVYYSNVTQAWSMDTKSRIIINLAGIYFQLLFATALLLIVLISGITNFIIPAYAIVIHSLFSLNPFIRSDGYWIISDLTNTPNLLSKSKAALNIFINNPTKEKFNWTVLYSLGNFILLTIITVNIVIITKFDILYFPLKLFDATYNIITNHNTNVIISSYWVYYISIYLIVISLFIKIVKKKILVNSTRKKLLNMFRKIKILP